MKLWILIVSLVILPIIASCEISSEVAQLLEKAQKGDARAQFEVGKRYVNGDGVSTNFEEAVKWFRISAAQSNAIAQYCLGVCYVT